MWAGAASDSIAVVRRGIVLCGKLCGSNVLQQDPFVGWSGGMGGVCYRCTVWIDGSYRSFTHPVVVHADMASRRRRYSTGRISLCVGNDQHDFTIMAAIPPRGDALAGATIAAIEICLHQY